MTGSARLPLVIILAGTLALVPTQPVTAQPVTVQPFTVQGVTDPDCLPLSRDCDRLPRFLEDLAERVAPLLDDLAGRIDPFVDDLRQMLGDLSRWEAPEILPNGDILIRRRRPPPEAPQDQPESGDSVPPVLEPFEL